MGICVLACLHTICEGGRPKLEGAAKLKKGPLAWENAERDIHDGIKRDTLRLLVHGVNFDTNRAYTKEVLKFLKNVVSDKSSVIQRKDAMIGTSCWDSALAEELDHRCYRLREPISAGQRLYHGFCHVYPEFRGRLPVSLRALHNWEQVAVFGEG